MTDYQEIIDKWKQVKLEHRFEGVPASKNDIVVAIIDYSVYVIGRVVRVPNNTGYVLEILASEGSLYVHQNGDDDNTVWTCDFEIYEVLQ